jgi:hypothetical protein
MMYGIKKPYPFKITKDNTEIEITDDNNLIDLIFETYEELKGLVGDKAKVELKHAINKIITDNNLTGKQVMDRRTEQLIKLYKTRDLSVINSLDYHIFFEVVNLLIDTEPRL